MLNDRFHYLKIYARHLFITVLALMLVISGIPANIFASSPPVTLTGSGTEDDPYLISTAQELNEVRNNLTAYYKLTSDIDLSEYLASGGDGYNNGDGWVPIGSDSSGFNGYFDGDGHTISNLYINLPMIDDVGLFGYTDSSATIRNTKLDGVAVTGYDYVGGLVGHNNGGTIHNASLVDIDVIGTEHVGGLMGVNTNGIISDSNAIGGTITGDYNDIGGLVGVNNNGAISNSYAANTAYSSDGNFVGGLVGLNQGSITSSYATGDVSSDGGGGVGGLVGNNFAGAIADSYATGATESYMGAAGLAGNNDGTIINSYATGVVTGSFGIGGLVANNYGTITNSYYDIETTGQINNNNGEPKSTEDMMKQETFTNWDFTNKWKIIKGSSYPKLIWQSWTDEEAILLDLNLLTWDIIEGENVTESEVTKPLNLPTSGVNGTTIDWSVEPDDGWLNTSNGTITRPSNGQGDKNVILTATVSKGSETSQTKTFNLTIKEAATLILQSITPVPDIEVPFGTSVDDAKAALAATTTIIDSNNQSHDVTLDWTISNYDGNIAGDYSAVGTFTLPTGVEQTDPETALKVTATVTVQASSDVFLTGSGTEDDPYLISTAQELNEVRNSDLYAHYKLTRDIDLSDYLAPSGDGFNDGKGWIPILDFKGIFDGAGYSIKNLYINQPNFSASHPDLGLFGATSSNAEIHNLHLLDVNIKGKDRVGGLVGKNDGKITFCSVTGSVEGGSWVGGLVGYNKSNGMIANSYVIANVTGGNYVGGLVGLLQPNASITNSYATGLVDGSGSGGLVGVNALGEGIVNDSYYDYEITEQYDEGNGEPKSTEDMMKQETFTNWDFTNTWKIIEGNSYPKLIWQSWTDEEAILLDFNLLTWNFIKGENVTESEVTKPLNLPTSGVNGTTIDWSVLPDEGWLNTSNGTITRPSNGQGDKNVILTATVSKGAETSQTKTFNLTIKEAAALILKSITPVPDIEVPFGTSVDDAKADLAATTTIRDSNNQSHDVTLDWTISNYDGSIAGDYSAIGTFALPTGVGQTDPETALEVTATVTVQASSINTDASLSDLTLNGGTLNQPFAVHITNYSSSVSNSVATITVTPTAANSKALVKVNGLPVDSGQISQPINLSVGSNTITILVTAEDTEYTKIYTITVQRATASGGGSGGSNNSDNPNGGTQPEETPLSANVEGMKTPAILESATGLIKVELGTTLLNKAFDAATENIDGNKQIKVELPKSATGRYSIGLPVASLSASKANQNIVIHSDIASVTITNTMLTGLGFENKENVSITINNANKEELPQEIKNAIGNRPVIQLGLMIDGEQQAWNNPHSPVTIAIPYKPSAEELKDPEHITIWYLDGAGKIVAVPSGRYDPATGLVTFTTTHFSNYAVVYVQKSFEDMNGLAWAKKSVEVLASKGIISGTSQTTFSPSANISRADYLVLLINTLGLTAQFDSNFEDVKEGTYYYEAVGIAKQLGITLGVGNNRFNPKEIISRQDMMVLTARALQKFKNLTVTDTDTVLMKFSDKGNIAEYAANSIAALIKEELIIGNGDKINPLADTSRAEAAVFLYRIYNKNY